MILLPATMVILFGCIIIPNSVEANDFYELYGEFNQPRCLNVSNQLYCRTFDNWLQATALLYSTPNLNDFFLINLKPNNPLLLNSDLNIAQAIANQIIHFFEIYIYGLKSIEVIGWLKNVDCSIHVYASSLTFFMNGSAPGDFQCTEQLIKSFNSSFFSYFIEVYFEDSVVYDLDVTMCPYMFSNAKLNTLNIGYLVDSFVVKNLLKFQTELQNSLSSINSIIAQLEVSGYHFKLDETLMHPLVFEKVIEIVSFSTIGSIQVDLFKSFKNLNKIFITEFSLKNFFHQVGIEWTSYLNQFTVVTFSDFRSVGFPIPSWLSDVYTYPRSDVCIFSSFPIQKEVFSLLNTNLTVCTDTIAWLTQNYNVFNQTYPFQLTMFSEQMFSICLENSKTEPNMTLIQVKIDQCLLHQSNGSKQQGQYILDGDYYQVQYLFEFVVNLLAFVFIPFGCIAGLLLNVRVIWTIRKNRKVELKDNFYKYMSLNSKFNCLFCLIYVFYPINFCQKYETGYFCSTIYTSIVAQVYKIFFMTYFGESIKMCSNISYILISVNRYMLIGKEHSPLLEKISKWKIKKSVPFTILFSLLINIGHIFQYRINYGWGPVNDNYINYQMKDFYPAIVSDNVSLGAYILVYFILNFGVFFLVNTWIEVRLVRKLHDELTIKRKKIAEEIELTNLNNSAHSTVVNRIIKAKQKKIEQDNKKEQRAIIMVISNSVINFILRLPEIFVFISSSNSLFPSNSLYSFFNSLYDFTSMMVSFSYFAYILTFITNVFIYYLFNTKFKQLFIFWPYYVRIK
jgi:hypothetical protein